MRLKPNNYVAPLFPVEKPNESAPVAPPLGRRITVDPGAIFAEPVVKQPTPIDYVSQGIGFNLKYAPLFVILAILAYGLAIKSHQDFWFGTVLFGTLSVIGYWALGFMENIFEPTSGHVVRSFFGYLVLKAEIASSERTQAMYYETEQMRLQNEQLTHEINLSRRDELLERMVQPQSQRNMLTTFDDEPVLEHPPIKADIYTIPQDEVDAPPWVDKTGKTLDILMSFVMDLYEKPDMLCEDGTLAKGVVAPWAKRSDNSEPVKNRIKDLIHQTTPRLFVLTESKLWRLNLKAYPDYDAACEAIESARVRNVGNVGVKTMKLQ